MTAVVGVPHRRGLVVYTAWERESVSSCCFQDKHTTDSMPVKV